MIKIVRSLANVRPPKSTDPELITTPTPGNIRINIHTANLLGLGAGDYIDVVEAEGGVLYVSAGSEGDAEKKLPNVGAKLGAAGKKTGGSLIFSSSNIYQILGGNSEKNRIFVLNPMYETDENGEGKFFKLNFYKEIDKLERNSDDEEEANAEMSN